MSEKLNLRQKLIQVYSEIDHVEKAGINSKQNYRFVRSADVLRAVRSAFARLGIYAETNYELLGTYDIKTNAGGVMHTATVRATLKLYDADSDETKVISGLGDGADSGDKGIYKAQTGATKNALRNGSLLPDESDPEMDESIDTAVSPEDGYRNPEPDFQSAQRGEARPPAQPRTQRAATAPAAGKPAPVLAVAPPKAEIPNSLPDASGTPVISVAGTARPSSGATTAADNSAPAAHSDREPGEESAGDLNRKPTEAELNTNTKRYRDLINEVSDPNKGKLKSSTSLPIPIKVKTFMLDVTKVPNVNELTQGQWLDFFTRVDKIKNSEHGLVGLATLINRACGVEPKQKKK